MMRNELGNAIRNARMEKKLTQEKLAELVNISPVHVKQIEAGTRMPSVEVLYFLKSPVPRKCWVK